MDPLRKNALQCRQRCVAEGAELQAEAEAYRRDLLAAVERTIALSPVVPVRDGTYHSVIPFACYVRGLSTGALGWISLMAMKSSFSMIFSAGALPSAILQKRQSSRLNPPPPRP